VYEEIEIAKEIVTSTARIRLLKGNWIHNTYFPNAEIDAEKHLENHKALIELAGDKKFPVLVDGPEIVFFTADAKKTAKELEPVTPTLKRAFVTNSLGHRMLINFYLKVYKPNIPNKVFSNYAEALVWMKQQKE